MHSGSARRTVQGVAKRVLPARGYTSLARRYRQQMKRRHAQPNRYVARTTEDATGALVAVCKGWAAKRPGRVVVIGDDGQLTSDLRRRLAEASLKVEMVRADKMGELHELADIACIALGFVDGRQQFDVARALVADDKTADIPLEYVALPREDNAPILEWDKYINGDFVSPLLVRRGQAFYDIYREALTRFRLKTDIRDYLDLAQLLDSVVSRDVPGDVAEFGSYKGHSGYLISKVLEEVGSSKRVHMFDMFESFPEEDVGIDGFWSGTHEVDFDEVKSKFHDRDNVAFVKGDFTETLAASDIGDVALAFVDCDSYRATRSLLPQLWERHIPVGGIVVMEDYGHAALLGNRLAVHEFFDGRDDAFTNFSQFSGFFVAVRLR